MDFKTIATLIVTCLAAIGAASGHSIPADQQSELMNDLTGIATAITILGPIVAGIFHKLRTNSLTKIQPMQKGTQP